MKLGLRFEYALAIFATLGQACHLLKRQKTLAGILLIIIGIQFNSMADQITELNAKGRDAYKNDDYATAVVCFSKLIPFNDPDAYYYRGLTYFEMGEYDKTISDINESIVRFPRKHAFTVRGNAYAKLQDHQKAVDDYTEAIKQEDLHKERIYYSRAQEFYLLREYYAALIDCKSAVMILSEMTNSEALLGKTYMIEGLAYEGVGQIGQAFTMYSMSIPIQRKLPISSQDYLVFSKRGRIYDTRGRYDEAISDYKEAVHIDPESPVANFYLASFLAVCADEKYRDGKQAMAYAKKACELNHWNDSSCLETYAAATAEAGRFDEAVKWQMKAISLDLKGERLKTAQERLELYQHNKPYHEVHDIKGA